MAKEVHKHQKRDEWSPYIIHPMSVAVYAMRDWLDTDSIIACLLHDVVEDTEDDVKLVQKRILESFWEKSLYMIEKLSKKIWNDWKPMGVYYSEISADENILKIKWFDRLNNIYSLFLQPDKGKISYYIKKTEQEILPLIFWTETFYNIENILNVIKSNQGDFSMYKEKIDNIRKINEEESKL
jgi:(p)ppGpp synthase/HD superfamily hydrolase